MSTSDLVIHCDRIILRAISRDYIDQIFTEFTKEITKYMFPAPAKDIKETQDFVDAAIEKNTKGEEYQAVILKKDTEEFLGLVGIHELNTKFPEFGVWLKKSAHGFGYGREAIFALRDYMEQNHEFEYIVYPADEANTQSCKIPIMMGGKEAKRFDKQNCSGDILHMIQYHVFKRVSSK